MSNKYYDQPFIIKNTLDKQKVAELLSRGEQMNSQELKTNFSNYK